MTWKMEVLFLGKLCHILSQVLLEKSSFDRRLTSSRLLSLIYTLFAVKDVKQCCSYSCFLFRLYVFRHIKDYKILVCGGDGTVGWVLQCLDNVGQDSECSSPPCAVVPLGTGNDLARVLRWGSGYAGGEDPLNLLRDVIEAEEVRLDRWTVIFHTDEAPQIPTKNIPVQDQPSVTSTASTTPSSVTAMGSSVASSLLSAGVSMGGSTSEDNASIYVMNNYFGLGIDADLCLGFHNAREENPERFNSRFHNKGVYVKMGLRKMVSRKSWKDLQKEIRLEVDGKVVNLPPVEGIIILNILRSVLMVTFSI